MNNLPPSDLPAEEYHADDTPPAARKGQNYADKGSHAARHADTRQKREFDKFLRKETRKGRHR